jgi:ParB-like chromosome segregation protein Spo0J
MWQPVKTAFANRLLVLPLSSILPLKRVTDAVKHSEKYRRIAASVAEVGIIEPLVVARSQESSQTYLLLDGHMRHSALLDIGKTDVQCLIASDDEAFTYNKRVNHLATVQEHFMIVRAIERGVSEVKLAKALNVNIDVIKRRRSLLDGICEEVVDTLRDRSINPDVFDALRKMKPMRQIEATELMAAAANFTGPYAKAILAATRQHDLVHPERPKKVAGMGSEAMARMEREMEAVQQDFKAVEASYGDDVLNLVIASGYVGKLINNAEIASYLEQHYPEIIAEFRTIVAASSLEQAAVTT